ncbi:Fumarylacetoacetate (FAA) hydrolase OS=Tsukamurella paurometabola (strain ATCC 8368 / DSM /CCUG 35730 / CIP 100753 / JCM 10117 / KCTC 9821 / NBRC 16120/ NCIMB 702349 / NCTC 13040) OX=521096 GN=Tpau_2704 PE=4 SV=1 [Tsukamurella paurometabola]|uniref:Fumarylacetoacetate (FAA) hydrolase n=1 Tax=Tsukamurella paurometabola (strain ATCC 8368 / DSM 20162 / CCUG 35730 / CIP 100753 / JCM 10117 / KCTC 9821 / NBRC 16120 / NCIMB 702349 / NCTC 13040) TaxID=521096 RepID=D5USN2_TSUPD|nr:fumarylacetoacetate hydrolase family protein [Tsukamurella paurometabola]ADG79303.1 fumarylacetoacetate (FAA) hydrolase [Tsukamurella paurometabola DSM 20162]SUP34994.1 2-keto-4-pentenoate hydratase/2-oxohepta-3-ene-1,7-dioic acid hydratase (catechol pathway) [Tsukamurella paurometabola]
MRLGRVLHEGWPRYVAVGPDLRSGTLVDGDPFAPGFLDRLAGPEIAIDRLLAPVIPGKIVVVGKNYPPADSATPLVLNLKPSTSAIGPADSIRLPGPPHDVQYEGELAVVIGQRIPMGSRFIPQGAVFGYTCANDVTDWAIGLTTGHWTRAKSRDSFCPLGPVICTDIDPDHLAITTVVNHRVVQRGDTSAMIRSVGELIALITAEMTLLPGDVILTGTPPGGAALSAGETVSVTIDRIGTLTNHVVAPLPTPGESFDRSPHYERTRT